jgi:hypothetical protein
MVFVGGGAVIPAPVGDRRQRRPARQRAGRQEAEVDERGERQCEGEFANAFPKVRMGPSSARRSSATAPRSFRHACGLGLEGIVSKRIGSRYVSGRTRAWLKTEKPDFQRSA